MFFDEDRGGHDDYDTARERYYDPLLDMPDDWPDETEFALDVVGGFFKRCQKPLVFLGPKTREAEEEDDIPF